MNGVSKSRWNRQIHRWLSVLFTLSVVANFVARAISKAEPSPWLTYAPLPPLFLLLLTGLYMLIAPYLKRSVIRPFA